MKKKERGKRKWKRKKRERETGKERRGRRKTEKKEGGEKNKKEIANAYNNIGMVYDYTGDLDKGLEYYDRARIAYEALGDKRGALGQSAA